MCGFIAIVNKKKLPIEVGKYLDIINHRGPDDRGWLGLDGGRIDSGKDNIVLTSQIILGHVRLAILDLTQAGWQPMSSGDCQYSIVFNGEIYNFVELRKELEAIGHRFQSDSDTEILLHALIEWGQAVIPRLRGMFAFVFINNQTGETLVARDFFGIKPLYWCHWDGGVAFASEAEPLLALPGVRRHYSNQAAYEYLLVGASDHGEQSLYDDLKHIPAACYAKFNATEKNIPEVKPIRYWKIDLSKQIRPSFPEAVKRVRELFLESVSLHMRSDVPVGAALSGGVDSSAIVCAIRHLFPDHQIHTFSFIAEDEGLSEEKWVDIVNEYAGCIGHKVYASKNDLINDLDDLIHTQGEPFGSTSIYAQYKVFGKVGQQGIKVCLDGQGADEMLAGYVTYQGSRLASLISSYKLLDAFRFLRASVRWPGRSYKNIMFMAGREILPNSLRWIGRRLISKGVPPHWISKEWISKNHVNPRPPLLNGSYGKESLRSRLLETLCETSIPHLLRYEDRNSMRFSVESRVPFLHVDLVEYLYSLPEEYLISNDGCSKYVFREAMRGIVPDAILDRRDKVGFATPEKTWLAQMNEWVERQFAIADTVDCFNSDGLKDEWSNVMSGKTAFNFKCWRWLNFLAWEKSKR